jgi:hypothetical protein
VIRVTDCGVLVVNLQDRRRWPMEENQVLLIRYDVN